MTRGAHQQWSNFRIVRSWKILEAMAFDGFRWPKKLGDFLMVENMVEKMGLFMIYIW